MINGYGVFRSKLASAGVPVRPGWDGTHPVSSTARRGIKLCIPRSSIQQGVVCARITQKCHPDLNGETVKRCSPVCVYATSGASERFAAGLNRIPCPWDLEKPSHLMAKYGLLSHQSIHSETCLYEVTITSTRKLRNGLLYAELVEMVGCIDAMMTLRYSHTTTLAVTFQLKLLRISQI